MRDGSDVVWRAASWCGAPKRMIAAFRKRHGARVRVMHLLSLDWPEMRATMEAVAGYVTDGLVGRGRLPLLHRVLLDALADYEDAVTATRPDQERLGIFVDRLLGGIAALTEGVVLRAPDGARWRAADGIPLAEWLVGRDAGGLVTAPGEGTAPGHRDAVVFALQWLALPRNVRQVLGLDGGA